MGRITKDTLIEFEADIASCFNNGIIKAPVHLYDGNEDELIEIFSNVKENDWVFCT